MKTLEYLNRMAASIYFSKKRVLQVTQHGKLFNIHLMNPSLGGQTIAWNLKENEVSFFLQGMLTLENLRK